MTADADIRAVERLAAYLDDSTHVADHVQVTPEEPFTFGDLRGVHAMVESMRGAIVDYETYVNRSRALYAAVADALSVNPASDWTTLPVIARDRMAELDRFRNVISNAWATLTYSLGGDEAEIRRTAARVKDDLAAALDQEPS